MSSPSPHNLPAHLPALIGRDRALADVEHLLLSDEVGLLTLTGPGGVGKTRLALAAARNLLERFPDGVFLVELASIRSPELVLPTVAQTLGLQEVAGQATTRQLEQHLAGRHLLLVLDNFEQVLEAAADLARLLASCQHLEMLVTSRAPLRVSGERVFEVAPLALPDATRPPRLADLLAVPAVCLFAERAQAACPDFALTEANRSAIIDICRRLDGLPLAIELAATRVRALPPEAIAGRLEQRFALLVDGPRDAPARQRTLRSAIDWSYQLLEERERRLFRRLAVFLGGCTLPAIEAICATDQDTGDVLAIVCALVDNHLVVRLPAADGEPRFGMLETIREYALEQLVASSETEVVRERHQEFYLAMAEEASSALRSARQDAWLRKLDLAYDNLRAALAWCREAGQAEAGLRLAAALERFWSMRGYWSEGRAWLEGALGRAHPGEHPLARAKALYAAGLMARTQGDYAAARNRLQESVVLLRELDAPAELAFAALLLGLVYWDQDDYGPIAPLYEEAMAAARHGDDEWTLGLLHNVLGMVAAAQGDLERAETLCAENLRLAKRLGDQHGVAEALNTLGDLARRQGDYPKARQLYDEALELTRLHNLGGTAASVLHNLAYVAHVAGKPAQARELFADSLRRFRDLGDKRGMAECLAGLAAVAASQRRHERAAQLLGASASILEAIGSRISPSNAAEQKRTTGSLQKALDQRRLEELIAAGRAMPVEAAIDYGLVTEASASPGASTEGLTARELQVAALVAQGFTNRDMAARLVISERTAATHVEHILNKLGLRSRAQIAAWAAEHALRLQAGVEPCA